MSQRSIGCSSEGAATGRRARGLPVRIAVLVASALRTVVVQLTVDNPLIWRRMRGRHPLAELEGPEYLLGAPYRVRYLVSREARARCNSLRLCGRVFDRETGAPLVGATVEVWQADPETGCYAWLGDELRGKFRTDAHGRYVIETVVPPVGSPLALLGKISRRVVSAIIGTVGWREAAQDAGRAARGNYIARLPYASTVFFAGKRAALRIAGAAYRLCKRSCEPVGEQPSHQRHSDHRVHGAAPAGGYRWFVAQVPLSSMHEVESAQDAQGEDVEQQDSVERGG